MDIHSPERRTRIMAAIPGKDTKPELIVRSIAHRLGFRFRLHRRDLPGSPDLAFPRLHRVVFVHGCFWYQHDCRPGNHRPKSRIEFWRRKFIQNAARDRRSVRELSQQGWQVLVIWECETRDKDKLARRLRGFLSARRSNWIRLTGDRDR
ncbi:MAG TPA: DNA mismatch endonuclease Vsr [Tepidisphaeraceae bacterium]|jgi:DNA mismatch endonuclease (patch repair protein)